MKSAIRFAALAVILAFCMTTQAALIGPSLQQQLDSDFGPYEVIITFEDGDSRPSLTGLVGSVVQLEQLPMAGAVVTRLQLELIAALPGVRSIYLNEPLEYSNFTSGEITGGHTVHDERGVRGAGVTIAVLDSGVDATHQDLAMGSTTIENVKIVGDLDLLGGMTAFLEGQPNTDTSSGHGTHVAGTVAGSGAASSTDTRRPYYHDGIAPDATLVGLGAGEAIAVLHALLGFEYSLANQERLGIDIITNSWGGGDGAVLDPNNPINVASYEAYRRGMVVLFAASNSGPDDDTLNQYAIAPWVINVAAGTPEKALADFSSRGVAGDPLKHPDITAPGSGIVSTRALLTPLPALEPVIDPDYPEYAVHYAGMSGTSMATPFVAGAAALLLSTNPQLSPDQVEDILVATADPMPGYAFHQVGAGYINVRAAVEAAQATTGARAAFLDGDVAHAASGNWEAVADSDDRLVFSGNWRSVSAGAASDGVYRELKGRSGSAFAKFAGSSLKLHYLTDRKGGTAAVYVDGQYRDTISFYSGTREFNAVYALGGLGDGVHTVELRAIEGGVYLDGLLVDGALYPVDVSFVDETQVFTGTLGPSVENLQVVRHTIEVGDDATTISAVLSWTGLLDADLYLVDPDGNQVASGATLGNPESLSFAVQKPGTYTFEVTGYVTLYANYTLEATVTRAIIE